MLKLMIEKELREIISSSKFAITFGTCALLILLTFYIGGRNYQISMSQYESAVNENFRQMEKLTDWYNINHKIFLKPQPLTSLVTGISNDVGRNIQMFGRGMLHAEDSRFNEDPIYAVFRFLDLEFLFMIIISLFAILFAYNSINGEKEMGTLRLSFANSVPRSKFILAKLTGSFIALGIPLLIPILIGCFILPFFGIQMSGDEWLKLIFILLTGFLYFGLFLTLSIFVSALTKQSSSSFLILLVIWIFSVLIIPRSSVLLAGRAIYVPSVDEIATQKNKFQTQLWDEFKEKLGSFRSTKTGEEMMTEFHKFNRELNDDRDKKMRDFENKLEEDRRNRQIVQENLAFGIGRISPAVSFSLAVSNFAGSSLNLKQDYLEKATQYQKKFAEFQKEKTGDASGGMLMFSRTSTGGENEEKPKPINPREIPEFKYASKGFGEVLSDSLLDLALLIIFNILFFICSFIAFLKYDLR